MINTYLDLGGSDMNWVASLFFAVVSLLCLWVFAIGYLQLGRNEMTAFSFLMLFVRIGIVLTVSTGVSLWMT